MTAHISEHPYTHFIERVEKPGRYLGGEYNSVVKDHAAVSCTFCLAFPDIYDIGMSHMGTKILYSIVNRAPDLVMERCFTPWFDMEEQLRSHGVPLLSLETHRPLRVFDVVGFSLQYEMTYTNVLTMLDLGGIPLRNIDRLRTDPLVIAGGPSATHPEPMTPFIDLFLIGDAEERLPRLLRHWAELRRNTELSRLEMLAELAREGGVYCPDLYDVAPCPRTGLQYVASTPYEGVPARVQRAFLDDISRYRFPDDSPVPVAEAIFDRMAIEISRGCTEGCRFCQAGMIYRPVRERDPQEVIDTVLSALDKGGFDEASITSLSTADYSCISPLIRNLMEKLRERKVALGISSLRAYGLSDDLLDEIASVKATGLTFAPEAGTQRMRDVINKNITDENIYTTCHRVFSKGWQKMKLYFILGLPTETDDDVLGIAKMGRQAAEIGREYHQRGVQVTVSVSSHVPKPHTPFQWAAMDSLDSLEQKQRNLRDIARPWGFTFRRHDQRVNWLECITGRGDRRVGDLIEAAWHRGARFDGWDEHLRWDVWQAAIAEWETRHEVDHTLFFGTLPIDAKLPWDHIDVGLEDGFLRREYQRALASRLSPPCGKPKGEQVHHSNLADAVADERKLICYHCGIACDMTQMREERISFLERLGAYEAPETSQGNAREKAMERRSRGQAPNDFQQGEPTRFRARYAKLGAACYQGHLDLVRMFPRIGRRAGLELFHTEGFSPRPVMSFGPALGLGQRSLGELVEFSLVGELPADEVLRRLNASAPDGLVFTGVRRVAIDAPELGASIQAADMAYTLMPDVVARHCGQTDPAQWLASRITELRADAGLTITVIRKEKKSPRRFWDIVQDVMLLPSEALHEAGIPGGLHAVGVRLRQDNGPSMRAAELLSALFGEDVEPRDIVRMRLMAITRNGEMDPLLHGGRADDDVAMVSLRTAVEMQQAAARSRTAAALIPGAVPDLLALAGARSQPAL